eukprot:m.535943 g.535943  ORF g.535943 m.535943 type:complete len:87 (+) comp22067_c0_seq8:1118-1378(+)
MHRRARQAYHMPTTSECTQENSLPTQAVMQGHIVLQRTSGAIQYGDPTTDCAARFSNEDFNVSEFLGVCPRRCHNIAHNCTTTQYT